MTSAAPLPPEETKRLHSLYDYGVLDTPPEAAFDELVALAARICGTPVSLVSFVDRDRQWFKARQGLALSETPRDVAFCAHAIIQPDELLIVPDARLDPRFADNPLVTGELGVRFYAGVPLCTPAGHAVGTLCVIDRQPRTLNSDQQETLRTLGRQVVAQLELRRSLNTSDLNLARLENSQRIAGLGDWDYDFAHHRLIWSAEVYRILGVPREETSPDSAAFYRRVHPDDLAFVRREKESAAQGLRRVEFEHRIIRGDGEVRHLHQVAELFSDEQGQPVRESGTIQDITERKRAEEALGQSEERFKFVARAVSDAVWDWDLAANTMWWNDGFLTTFGFGADEVEPSIQFWTSRIPPDERTRVMASIHDAINADTEAWRAEYRFQRKDGRFAFVEHRGYILRNAARTAVRMVGGLRDLTEQKHREAQNLRSQRMESIGTLAGGIAHDLNNVLAPIMMSIELLKRDPRNDPRRSEILDIIHGSCRRGADLVRQVLTFVRGRDGQRVTVRLRQLITDLKGIISATFPRNIAIVTRVADGLWPLTGDPTQIHQVLLNLAVNARDAMPRGGTLTLAVTNVAVDAREPGMHVPATPGSYVLLEVTDTGCGIPPEMHDRIFEPFFTTKELGKGTGLGLPTVQSVVKEHSGFIRVESEVGLGTTFKIYLPAAPVEQPGDGVLPAPADLPLGCNELVLVVDDEFSIRDITQQTLEAFGYRVVTARNGAEAVAIYAEQCQEIAVVVIDLMMPVMGGTATIEALRLINPFVQIIGVSGLESGEQDVGVTSAGVSDFLPKPYTAETLLKRIRNVLDRAAVTAACAPP